MKVITVVGARPNFMKAAPIIAAIRKHNVAVAEGSIGHNGDGASPKIDHLLVHTGQHYDAVMSDAFFADLNLPAPDIRLGVGSGSQAVQTAEILKAFEDVLLRERPDVVVVVGDVNSTVACALATAKSSFDSNGTRPLLAHVEAGLRSFERSMPEEINRVVTDHISDVLFVTEESGIRNLHNEGIASSAVQFVGNTMIDSVLAFQERAEHSDVLERVGLARQQPYALLTLHRPSNVDNRETFLDIVAGLDDLAQKCPIVFPVHPRTEQRIRQFGLQRYLRTADGQNGIVLIGALGYLDFLCLMKYAAVVVTDSGGIQEETTCLRVPCVTVREQTERPVTVECGTNVIVGTAKENIRAAIEKQIGRTFNQAMPKMWDGQAAGRVVEILVNTYCQRKSPPPADIRICSSMAQTA